MTNFKFRGYDRILILIDILSRKAFAYPMKSNKLDEIKENYNKFLKEVPKPYLLIGDDEFNKSSFIKLNQENETKTSFVVSKEEHISSGNSLGIIDRFIRTFRSLLLKYMVLNDTTNWLDAIDKLLKNYNNTPHSAFKNAYTPNEVWKSEKLQDKFYMEATKNNFEKNQERDIDIGVKVRVIDPKYQFDKEKPYFKPKIHEIDEIIGNSYKVVGSDRKYKFVELQKITGDVEKRGSQDNYEKEMKQIQRTKKIEKMRRREGVEAVEVEKRQDDRRLPSQTLLQERPKRTKKKKQDDAFVY
jgi:hypothetical protein